MDCVEGMKMLPDNSVDLVLTDPPYGISKEGITNDTNLNEYYKSLPIIYDKLKLDTFFLVFVSIKKLNQFFYYNPFQFVWQYILYINNGMVRGSLGFNKYMSILIFKKGNPKICSVSGDVMEVSTSAESCAKRKHPTEKPDFLIRKLLIMFSKKESIILDPFMGSGTTAVACQQLNRNFIGFEIEQKWCDIANQRLEQKTITDTLARWQ